MNRLTAFFRHINRWRFVAFVLYVLSITTNIGLAFNYYYDSATQQLGLLSFLVAVVILLLLPTYFVASTHWLYKEQI